MKKIYLDSVASLSNFLFDVIQVSACSSGIHFICLKLNSVYSFRGFYLCLCGNRRYFSFLLSLVYLFVLSMTGLLKAKLCFMVTSCLC